MISRQHVHDISWRRMQYIYRKLKSTLLYYYCFIPALKMDKNAKPNISGFPKELQLRLCEYLPIESIVNICETIPEWQWILHSEWFSSQMFHRSGHWTWMDRYICYKLQPPSVPTSFRDPLLVLRHHQLDSIRLRQLSSTSSLTVRSDKSSRVDFTCFIISSMNWHVSRMQSTQVRRNLDASTSDNSSKYVERIGKYEVSTQLRYAAADPLYEEFWKDFQYGKAKADTMVSCKEDKERRKLKDAKNLQDLYLEKMFDQISSADAVIYIVSSLELLWSDVRYLVDILCSHQVLIIVQPREGKSTNSSTSLSSLIRLLICLGGLANSGLLSAHAYWRLWCVQVDSNGCLKLDDIFTWMHSYLISRRLEKEASEAIECDSN